MSEFLMRGWNVAVPEVDIGDDIFVVRDENGEFVRVQVKPQLPKRELKVLVRNLAYPFLNLTAILFLSWFTVF
jgi:hypothetical protein